MSLRLIEFPAFTRRLPEVADDGALLRLQQEFLKQPDKGPVIQGTGGFRKVRMALPRSGKSGGARAIYLRVPEVETIILVLLYTKGEKTDLTPEERSNLRRLAAHIKAELL